MSSRPVRLALDLSRARITLLGFTPTVNLFAPGTLVGEAGSGSADRLALDRGIVPAPFISLVVAAVAMSLFLLPRRLGATGNGNVRVSAASARAARVPSLSRGDDAFPWPLFFGQLPAPQIRNHLTVLAR